MEKYIYNKTPVVIDTLNIEMDDAGLFNAYYMYTNHVEETGYLEIVYSEALPIAEKTTLDVIVSNHQGDVIYDDPGMVAIANGSGGIVFVDQIPPALASGIISSPIINNYYTTVVEGYNYSRYGNRYEYLNAEEEASTNKTTFSRRIEEDVYFPDTCTYKINWYYEWKGSKDNYNVHAHIGIDGNVTLMDQDSTPAGANSWEPASGFWMGTIASGTHNIYFEYAASHKNFSASVRRVRIEIMGVNYGE